MKILKKIKPFFGLILCSVFLTFTIYYMIDRHSELKDHAKYTIGTTIKIYRDGRGGRNIRYKYLYKGEYFEGTHPYREGAIVPGGKYLLKFSANKPDLSEIYFNSPMQDYSDSIPYEGWSEIPKNDSN